MTAVSAPPLHVSVPLECAISNVFHHSSAIQSANNDLEITNLLDGIDLKSDEVNSTKEQPNININHFYTNDGLDGEPSSLSINNDISQTIQHPKDTSVEIMSSISNVYDNFNDFMDTPSVSLINLDSSGEPASETAHGNVIDNLTGSFVNSFASNSASLVTDQCSIDELLSVREEALMQEKKECSAAVPPKYQNILLPIKLDSNIPEKSSESSKNQLVQDLEFSDLLSKNNSIPNVFDKPETMVKSLLDEPEHVYENVYIGIDIPKTQETFASFDRTATSLDTENKHTYENVNLSNHSRSLFR